MFRSTIEGKRGPRNNCCFGRRPSTESYLLLSASNSLNLDEAAGHSSRIFARLIKQVFSLFSFTSILQTGIVVRLGAWRTDEYIGVDASEFILKSVRWLKHGLYNPRMRCLHDIGLIQLEREVTGDTSVMHNLDCAHKVRRTGVLLKSAFHRSIPAIEPCRSFPSTLKQRRMI